ncbi:class I SAM-dependent methyltransferase [Vagococcus sp. BWB3-3]|uniref:Class I SAM-dependent methyltransferase n=1 Tax=Vagococcus allomyrinae TaxID=2794353 RepID=A0A940PA01_9ENTE|nr:class I SAM-dependent methyltransferase [Vagococcus allomyrinae]MBP1040203.1 class I SAM-dependent methyltransferase [Vagococcus allomyrinae]
MDKHLSTIASSYDQGITLGRKGVNLYENLPESITNHADFVAYQEWSLEEGTSDSQREEICDFLLPKTEMRFVDLGCCLNLMFNGYDRWPSTYYGVDISQETILLLREFIEKKQLKIGSLYLGSVHQTPFEMEYFDIGACIGVLEYFDKTFIEMSVKEMYRILKYDGKLVVDIPDINGNIYTIAKMIEAHLGRPNQFNISIREFENILAPYFKIEKREVVGPMIQYFLKRNK